MHPMKTLPLTLSALALAAACTTAQAETLTVFAAGTLGKSFTTLARGFEKLHPGVTVQPQFGGSVKMVKQVTVLHQPADVVAVADYSVIPKYMFKGDEGNKPTADWSIGFLGNAITFIYTPKSKGAKEINADNWWKILSEPGVQIGRSNPNTDPSGYQTLQMLDLAGRYYKQPDLEAKVLANSPESNMRDTETDLISALQLGQIDYLAIYRSDAVQHHMESIDLPPQINLSDPKFDADYAKASAKTKNGELSGRPIIYAVTIPTTAPHPKLAQEFIAYLLGPAGQKVIAANGFIPLKQPYAMNRDKVPADLRKLTVAWPR
ncbi:putative ABC-type molybdate transport system, periplasmic component [Thiomonas arsenitoxydans]|uniref:ABC-type molybdate transport system, periplasmic component n=2 Tax=Thiomonas arsenitoxydans (strain DSM 22701 / CIP 110005 / 3As) TaxID=426114 RepID=D6CV07_THIA3|nr:putative ABC-type molybdate transport system, periplasmic component [Thiomonas arsenitoxydans]CQR45311.1 putative ABC-type molybdate transport system, periplasmic component [Thiomonas sp. CB3]CQR36677.1 putative ABC-type molybdate transport system, periplasmic component [Thiomonas arsenitoxydans]CQR36684.1 putative ABC-type molybdate transport system, periplasmic component [Thiomonas arsenitoxydans]CQR37198.1 putative ABC-type molybdate transport system, periplasmic component [Thiomonas arse